MLIKSAHYNDHCFYKYYNVILLPFVYVSIKHGFI
jgi:hypothetical protein